MADSRHELIFPNSFRTTRQTEKVNLPTVFPPGKRDPPFENKASAGPSDPILEPPNWDATSLV